ncbi:MAG: ABC transporter substrate-binding protein [Oscillospiraceae bacterium]|nr:ABC transporter substrate-binding protein [Oscillospiraceae bacterium]
MKRALALALTILLLALSGCAGGTDVSGFAPGEGERLVIYTSHKEEVYGPIVKEFQQRTGIWVEVVTGGSNELLERIAMEAESGEPVCDLMFGGGVESLAAYEDCFEPCKPEGVEYLRDVGLSADDLWTPFSSLPMVLVYNTRLVPEGEVTGWADLLDPRWKGRIAFADPTVSGSGYTAALTLFSCIEGDDWDILAELVANLDGGELPDSGDVVESVRSGSRYIGVTLEETALKQLSPEVAIVYPAEGTSAVPDGCALIKGARHPENARAFLEFVIGRDVQELLVSDLSRRSVRTDVHAPEDLPGEAELGIIDYDVHWAGSIKEEFIARWTALIEEGGA